MRSAGEPSTKPLQELKLNVFDTSRHHCGLASAGLAIASHVPDFREVDPHSTFGSPFSHTIELHTPR